MNASRRHARIFGGAAVVALGCMAGSQAADSEVHIAADDIGGTVTSARGAEAGVWVIAETQDFQTRFAKIVVTDEAGRYLIPRICPRRSTASGCAATASPTRPKSTPPRAHHLNLTAGIAPDAATAAKAYPGRVLVRDDENSRGGAGRQAAGRPQRLSHVDEEHGLRRLSSARKFGDTHHPEVSGHVQVVAGGLAAAPAVRPGRRADDQHRARHARGHSRFTISRTGPTASPPANYRRRRPPRPSGIERNVVATVRDWSDGKAYLHDLSGTDRRNPTVNGNGLLYGAPELSTDNFPVLDPLHNSRDDVQGAACATRIRRRLTTTRCWRLRPIGARSESGIAGRLRTIRCSIDPAASGTPRGFVPRTIPRFAKKARVIRPPRCSRSTHRSANSRCMSRRAANIPSSTPASAPIICNSPKTRTTPCGPAAVMRSSAGSTPRNSI